MEVRLLVDLTSYDPRFQKGSIGQSNMKEFTRNNYNPRKYVSVEISGRRLDVGVDGVECLDEDYIAMKELEEKIRLKELIRMLTAAREICYVVGPRGGAKGIYVRTAAHQTDGLAHSREECEEILAICQEKELPVQQVLDSEFRYT